MNVEKTMEFILEQQAKFEDNFALAERRFTQADRRLDRLERLAKLGLERLRRNEKRLDRSEKRLDRIEGILDRLAVRASETDDKLDALIDIVDKMTRHNGGRP